MKALTPPLRFVKLPAPLLAKLNKLILNNKIENPLDLQTINRTLKYPDQITKAGVMWLQQVIDRNGAKFKITEQTK